ncbi:MAG: DHHA1 domain-containing protein, partial [Parvibaculales bacterium]
KDTYHRPSFVIALDKNGMGKGSARSVSSVDIGRLVAQAMDKGLIEAGGGHAMAAGVTLHKDQLPDFESYLTEELGGLALDAPHQLMLDASLLPSAASRDLFEMMQRAGPFGAGNPEPRVVLPSVRVAYAKIVGQGHVSCTLTDSNNGRLKAIAFTSVPDEVRGLLQRTKMPLHIAGFLRADDWNGKRGVQLVVHDAAELA